MPIFMDRHDMSGMTAEEIASAHRKDLAIQDKYDVNFMAHWIDRKRHTVFCLFDAPNAAAADRVHREAHGNVANTIIPVDIAAVEAFLGRVSDPKASATLAAPAVGAGLRAVMFTDIVGSTEMTVRLGDAAALEIIQAHDSLVRRALRLFDGREIKHTGDGIMACFENVANAVRAGAEIQRSIAAFNEEAREGLSVRIGVDAGEPVEHRQDLFGATVQLAARLCSECEPGGVVVSQIVRDLRERYAARRAWRAKAAWLQRTGLPVRVGLPATTAQCGARASRLRRTESAAAKEGMALRLWRRPATDRRFRQEGSMR
jgi:class 3 adenylate cyclase